VRGRSTDLSRTALALSLALAAIVALGGCRREAALRAAPFGGELAAPLPHADVLGFFGVVPSRDGAWLARPSLPAGLDVAVGTVAAPFAAMAKLAVEHPFVAPGAPLAVLFLDPDVHGAIAAFAWRGSAEAFEKAARAGGLRFDGDGRLLLPGRGRSFEIDVATEAMRRRGRGGDEEVTESPFPAKERPLLPHAVVEHDGVVAVLPARDGARNVFATLAATGLLDASAESLPCLRLASGRVLQRFRDVVSEAFQMGIDRVLLVNWDDSTWRTRNRLVRTVTGAIEAMSSVEELFACRADGRWRIFLRMRPGSFGESLLDVAANRPLAELLVDVPQDVAFVAGSLAPAVVAELPERLARSRDGFLRRVRVESGPPSRRRGRAPVDEPVDEAAEEAARAAAFFTGWTGRFWCAGALDGSQVSAPRRGENLDFKADAVGQTQVAFLFERAGDGEATGFVPTLVDTLVPKAWRAPLKVASLLVYRPITVERGLLEVVSGTPDAMVRETRMKMDAERLPPEAGPETGFLIVRAPAAELLAGDLVVARVGSGLELTFFAPER
jgi:hypothetical protein